MHMRIYAQGVSVSPEEEHTIKGQIERSLERFSENVGTISVYIKDVNGPRGGNDISVVIRARLRGRAELTASALRAKLLAATGAAARRAKRQVKRATQRQHRFDRMNLGQEATTAGSDLQAES